MNLVLASYFNTIKDPQRDIYWEADPKLLDPLIESLQGQKLILFTDCLAINNPNVEVIQVKAERNPYFQRWFTYYDYLLKSEAKLVFCVDSTDVVMLHDPFTEIDNQHIYVGDEREKLGNNWVSEHHPVLGNVFGGSQLPLLNLGVLGGSPSLLIPLMFDFKVLYMMFGEALGQTDMAAFNLLLHTKYKDIVVHGAPVNTQFKKFETETLAYWQHK